MFLFSGRGGRGEWGREGTRVGNSSAFGMFCFLSWVAGSPVFVFTELYAFYMTEIRCHTTKEVWALEADRLAFQTRPVLCCCVSSVFLSVKWGSLIPTTSTLESNKVMSQRSWRPVGPGAQGRGPGVHVGAESGGGRTGYSSCYCSCCCWGISKKNRWRRKASPQASHYGGKRLLLPRPGWPSVKLVTHLGLWWLGNLGPSTRIHEVMARAGWPRSTAPTPLTPGSGPSRWETWAPALPSAPCLSRGPGPSL